MLPRQWCLHRQNWGGGYTPSGVNSGQGGKMGGKLGEAAWMDALFLPRMVVVVTSL